MAWFQTFIAQAASVDPLSGAGVLKMFVELGVMAAICIPTITLAVWYFTRKVRSGESDMAAINAQAVNRETRMEARADKREQEASEREKRMGDRLTQVEDAYRNEFLKLFREVIQGQATTAAAVAQMMDVGERMTLAVDQNRTEMTSLRSLIASDVKTMQAVQDQLSRSKRADAGSGEKGTT